MNIIRQSNEKYLNMLGPNIRDEKQNIRLLTYLVIEDVDNGKAIFNELTRSFIWIPNIQWDKIYDEFNSDYVQWLWENYFLVNEDFDEQKVQDQLKWNCRPNPEGPSYLKQGLIYEFTIFTTMACNARCFYCYEKGRPQVPMKADTARKVADYIIRTAPKNGKQIELRWFGGEPLVNENVIDIICQKVKDAGYKYVSSITTNGFLFKQEKLDKYKDLWHLKHGQVTIDGTEEVYNKAKNYKNVKGKNPYQIVCDNVKMMADWGMNISIRMNMDLYNAEDIKLLIKEMHDKWGNHPNITPYCWPIFEEDDNPRTPEHNEELYTKLKEIDGVLKEYGYYHPRDRGSQIRATHCMIDHGGAVVISTQGDLGLCEHYSEEMFWGHVDKPEMRDMEMIKRFQDYQEHLEICKSCPILPSCIRAKMCHDLRICNIWIKEWNVRQAHDAVNEMYQRWRKHNNQQCNKGNCQCGNQKPITNDQSKIEEINKKGIAKFWENILIFIGLK